MLICLSKAGLNFNLDKYKFIVNRIKYLGFIIKVEKSININLKKIAAICN
jgi:hypothetical protein